MHERMVADAAVARDMALQGAELLGKGDLLVLAEILAAKRQHVMADERAVHRLPRRRVERPAEVEPDHLGAGDIRQRANFEVLSGGLAFHHG